jgi:hypothetical protein
MTTGMTGNWNGVSRLLARGANPAVWRQAKRRAVLREAHRLRGLMVESFNKGGPPGKRWRRLSVFTQLVSRALGHGDRRPLMRSGDLRNSHSVVERDDNVFVGVHRTTRGRKSRSRMMNIAVIQEFGAGPTSIRVTRKMRGFFHFLHIKTKGQIKPLSPSTTVIVVRIPPRPWIGPIWEQEADASGENIVRDTVSGLGIPGLTNLL